jgi:hypothetical protein
MSFFGEVGHMRRLSLLTLVALLLSSAVFGAQTAGTTQATAQVPANAVKLRGKIVDQTGGAMGAVDVVVAVPGQGGRVVATGKSDSEGNFELNVSPGPYQVTAKVADFKDNVQAVRVTADMAPLSITMSLGLTTEVVVNSVTNELGIDPDSSLNTDVITGDALLDLPDNEDDLLAYLTQLANLRGGDGTVTLAVDGFTDANLPPLAQIAEIRIVNSSFSADGSSGPRIEIVTRAGSGKWTASTTASFNDESFNALNHLATGKRPPSQRLNVTVNSSGPIIPGRLSTNISVGTQESDSAGSDLRAYTPNGYISNGISSINSSKNITIGPRLMINKVHNLTSNFRYNTGHTENSGVGGYNLPERASNNKNSSWQLQLTDRMTKGTMVDSLRFSVQHNSSENTAIPLDPSKASSYGAYILNPNTGLPYSINVTGAFNGGPATNNTHNSSDNYTLGNTLQWQVKPTLQFSAIAFELNYRKQESDNRNNYNGTYTFPGLYDYCATLSSDFSVGAQCPVELANRIAAKEAYDNNEVNLAQGKTLDITPRAPTQYTQTYGDSKIKVSQLEFATWVQGEWRMTPKANVSFGLRYQVQQHFADYNNLAPVAGLAYQLRSQGNWRTVVRAGIKVTHSTFSMGTYQQLRQASTASAQQTITILTPSYPDASLGGTFVPTTATNSTRRLMEDASQPYQVNPSFAWEQSMPRGMTASITYNINRGYNQNRNVNINAPYPGTDLDPITLSLLNSSDPTKYDPVTGDPDPINGLTKKQQGRAIVDTMRPFYPTTIGNITEIQSVGRSLTHTLSFQYRVNNYPLFNNKVRITGNFGYTATRGKDDSQFENPYNRMGDYGTSSGTGDRISGQVTLNLPRRMTLALQNLGWQSGRRYSLTLGQDINGDGNNTDYPDANQCAPYLSLSSNYHCGRNASIGPGSLSLPNARLSKIFILTNPPATSSPSLGRLVSSFAEPAAQGPGGGGGGGGGGNFGGGGGGGANNNPNRVPNGARTMTFTISANNVFNRAVATNINGNLSSPLFGQITGGSQGRTVTLQMQMKLF